MERSVSLLKPLGYIGKSFLSDRTIVVQQPPRTSTTTMESCGNLTEFHGDILYQCLAKLSFVDVFRIRRVCREFRQVIQCETFHKFCALNSKQQRLVGHGSSFSPVFFFRVDGRLEWMGFDSSQERWVRLPSLAALVPSPSLQGTTTPQPLKQFFITSCGGLVCANVSEDREREKIIICNPLTQTTRELPPMRFRRNPVLLHLLVAPGSNDYKVIAAGSAYMGTICLSRKMEVYDSSTNEWQEVADIPGPDHGLNEYQSGSYSRGILYFFAFSENGRVVLAFDVKNRVWLKGWKCSLPREYLRRMNRATNPQLLACGEHIHFFWEDRGDHPQQSRFCIAKLNTGLKETTQELPAQDPTAGHTEEQSRWSAVASIIRKEGTGLLSYPEYTCSAYGPAHSMDCRLCVFNTISHTAETYDVADQVNPTPIKLPNPPPLKRDWDRFHLLNPVAFSFEPSFSAGI